MSPKINTLKKAFWIQNAKLSLAALLVGSAMGCSVTSLQCGVDGDSSFVNLQTNNQVISHSARNMAELCSFAYEQEK